MINKQDPRITAWAKELWKLQQQHTTPTSGEARRIAELHQVVENYRDAAAWWHYAAKLGDPGATLFISYYPTPEAILHAEHLDPANPRPSRVEEDPV